MALSDRASHATLRIPRIDDQLSCGLASLNDHIKSSQEGYVEVTVQTSTLDQLDISDIAFVKIDVEGYEQEVLKGSVETIQKDHPIILIELEERYRKGTLQNSYDFLRCYRYKGYYYDKKEKLMKAYSVPMVLENQTGFYSGQQCDYMNNFIFIYGEDHTDIIEQINTRMKYVERYIDNSLEVKSDEEIALHRTEEWQ